MEWFDLARDYSLCTVENLEKLHTKQLLELRSFIIHNATFGSFCGGEVSPWDQYFEAYDRLRAVLATRPHILNKQESKAARISRKRAGNKRLDAKTRHRKKRTRGPVRGIKTQNLLDGVR